MNNTAKWITTNKFISVQPDDKIYHKEMTPYKPEYNKKLITRKRFQYLKILISIDFL